MVQRKERKDMGILVICLKRKASTCLSPGTSPTALPSARTQMISGWGFPLAWHSTTAPVPLEKSTRFGGSLTNTGPIDSSSAQATTETERTACFIKRTHQGFRSFSQLLREAIIRYATKQMQRYREIN